jgi:hypothetical protein
MKTNRVLMVAVALLSGWAWAEMHEFHLPDGRSIKAEIVDYNARLGTVELMLENKSRKKIDASIFVANDQKYIKDWSAMQAFSSDRLLKVACDEKEVEEWKKEEYADLSDTEGNVERTLMKETVFQKMAYEMELRNMNDITLNGLRMEYRIYYEQSEESFDKPEVVQRNIEGKLDIPSIPAKGKIAVQTNPVQIHRDNINSISWSDGGSRTGGKGKVLGLWARLYMKAADGKETMRDIYEPASMRGKYVW